MTRDGQQIDRPVLHVVRGDPAPEELAALTAVVAASNGRGADCSRAPVPPGGWIASVRARRRMPRTGPGAWAGSGRG